MGICKPEDPSAEMCEHLTSAKDSATAAAAVANRFFASSEMKIFGSFIAISLFLLIGILTAKVAEIGVLNQQVGVPAHPILGSVKDLYYPFIGAIVLHHCRIFLGLSYADDRRQMQILPAQGLTVAFERWLRTICTITFPLFAIFLFDTSDTAVFMVKCVWATQLVCIVLYDAFFIWRTLGGWRTALVVASDFFNVVFGVLFIAAPLIDDALSQHTGIRSGGTLSALLIIAIALVVLLFFIVEFCFVYARRVGNNLSLVWHYLAGQSLDAFKT